MSEKVEIDAKGTKRGWLQGVCNKPHYTCRRQLFHIYHIQQSDPFEKKTPMRYSLTDMRNFLTSRRTDINYYIVKQFENKEFKILSLENFRKQFHSLKMNVDIVHRSICNCNCTNYCNCIRNLSLKNIFKG